MEEIKKKHIAILGSTGSIGTQALEVIAEHPDMYEAYALTANNRVELLIEGIAPTFQTAELQYVHSTESNWFAQ